MPLGKLEEIVLFSNEPITINGEQCWEFKTIETGSGNSEATGYYAVSDSGKIYDLWETPLGASENEYVRLDSGSSGTSAKENTQINNNTTQTKNNADLLMIVNITGDNVNVRSAPNAQGKVLFQVSNEDFLAVNKKPIQDSSGQEWYEVIFHMGSEDDEFGRITTPAYIIGKFVKKHPESEAGIEEFGLGYYYTF
jgi:hypothetical protein